MGPKPALSGRVTNVFRRNDEMLEAQPIIGGIVFPGVGDRRNLVDNSPTTSVWRFELVTIQVESYG
jgi:hypothetical protein